MPTFADKTDICLLSASDKFSRRLSLGKFFINNKSISEIPDREKERIFLIEENNRSAEEKAYIKARTLTEKGTIESTSKAQLETLMDFKLAKNDEIYIPENFDYIEILGGINKPGRYAYSDEYNYLDYLDLAGGLTKNATDADVKKAYRKMAVKYHPDKLIGVSEDIKNLAEEKFLAVKEAYEQIIKSRN